MRALLMAAVIAAAACSPPAPATTYPPTTEINFMRACQSRSPVTLCACIWDKIEAEVPPAEFDALERLPNPEREAHPLMQQINGYALSCGTSQPATEPTATP